MFVRILLVVLALSPLGYLTFEAGKTAFTSQRSSTGGSGGSRTVGTVAPLTPEIVTLDDERLLTDLNRLALLGYPLQTPDNEIQASEQLDAILANWDAIQESWRQIADWPAATESTVVPRPRDREVPSETEDLNRFVLDRQHEVTALESESKWFEECLKIVKPTEGEASEGAASKQLAKTIEDEHIEVNNSVAVLRQEQQNAERLLNAHQAMLRKDYDEAVQQLDPDKWFGQPPMHVAELLRRCEFLNTSKQFLSASLASLKSSDTSELTKAKSAWDAITTEHSAGSIDAQDVETWRRCEVAEKRILVRLDVIQLGPPVDWPSWLKKAQGILQADKFGRAENHRILMIGLVGQFPQDKKTSFDPKFQYALQKNPKSTLIGKFTKQLNWYDFLDIKGNPLERVGLENVEAPEFPPMIEAVEAYNKAHRRLQANSTSRADWEAMRSVCEEWKTKITTFCERYNLTSKVDNDVELEDELDLARDVLEHWSQLEQLLDK